MKYAHSDILDGGLTALKTAATRMLLVKTFQSGALHHSRSASGESIAYSNSGCS